LFLDRFAIGVFFAISGYHKLFNVERHNDLVQTFRADHIPCVAFNSWFVPSIEFIFGVCLALGILSICAASLLLVICTVATCADGIKRIVTDYTVLDKADFLDDVLYLPEVLYGLMLGFIILIGPGKWSLDRFLFQ